MKGRKEINEFNFFFLFISSLLSIAPPASPLALPSFRTPL